MTRGISKSARPSRQLRRRTGRERGLRREERYLLSRLESVPEVAAKLKDAHTKQRKFEDVVKSVEQATGLGAESGYRQEDFSSVGFLTSSLALRWKKSSQTATKLGDSTAKARGRVDWVGEPSGTSSAAAVLRW